MRTTRVQYGCQDGSGGAIFRAYSRSANGRYLQKPDGSPFVVNECSSWGVIQSLSLANAQDFINRRAAQSFNTMKLSLISNDTNMPGSPPNWAGVAPFSSAGDFSTYNSAYFAHADQVIDYATSKGFLIILMLQYLGYNGVGGVQGWADEMNADSDAHVAAFTTFAVNRYKDRANIIWGFGGDQVPGTGLGTSVILSRFTSGLNACLAADPARLVTAHFAGDYQTGGGADDPIPGGMLSSDFSTFASSVPAGRMVDGLYSYNPSTKVYTRVRAGRAKSPIRPVIGLDQAAESGTQPQGSAAEVRAKAWQGMCEGACGWSYAHGEAWWYFSDWVSGSTGQTETGYWFSFWDTNKVRAFALNPEGPSSTTYITANRGTDGTDAFVPCLAGSSGLIAYLHSSSASSITVAMSNFSASVLADWYNPRAGTSTAINSGNPISNSGSQVFTKPDANDWTLFVRVP